MILLRSRGPGRGCSALLALAVLLVFGKLNLLVRLGLIFESRRVSAVDPELSSSIIAHLEQLTAEGKSVVLATHQTQALACKKVWRTSMTEWSVKK